MEKASNSSTNNLEMKQDLEKELSSLSFEAAMSELEKIINILESGNVELEEIINYYSKASKLQEYCSNKLEEAELRVETILHKNGNAYATEKSPLEDEYKK